MKWKYLLYPFYPIAWIVCAIVLFGVVCVAAAVISYDVYVSNLNKDGRKG